MNAQSNIAQSSRRQNMNVQVKLNNTFSSFLLYNKDLYDIIQSDVSQSQGGIGAAPEYETYMPMGASAFAGGAFSSADGDALAFADGDGAAQSLSVDGSGLNAAQAAARRQNMNAQSNVSQRRQNMNVQADVNQS